MPDRSRFAAGLCVTTRTTLTGRLDDNDNGVVWVGRGERETMWMVNTGGTNGALAPSNF